MEFKQVYFLGIGGIGMSALARFFKHEGYPVAGYDRTPSELTEELETEGIPITFEDTLGTIPEVYKNPHETLIVYTPALPDDHVQLNYFRTNGFRIVKRSRMLGIVSEHKYVMAVAGTHGKTTTSTMTAWFNHMAGGGGSAFLGGIAKNFDSNLVLGKGRKLAVEADEFDRSFLQLHPDVAVITAADPDHLDIYGTPENFRDTFSQFISHIKPGGAVILKKGLDLEIRNPDIAVYTYTGATNFVSAENAITLQYPTDFYADNIELLPGGYYRFDFVYPGGRIENCRLGIPGLINIENAVGAAAMVWKGGCDLNDLREAFRTFGGVKRRFDFYINTLERIYMDDYAHHPRELEAALGSFKAMFPERPVTVIFQPHLYTRTRDFFPEFASALSKADRVWLLPIYPAREEPIVGITSDMLLNDITVPARVVEKNELLDLIRAENPATLITFGAGDIDRFCKPIAELLNELDDK